MNDCLGNPIAEFVLARYLFGNDSATLWLAIKIVHCSLCVLRCILIYIAARSVPVHIRRNFSRNRYGEIEMVGAWRPKLSRTLEDHKVRDENEAKIQFRVASLKLETFKHKTELQL